MRPVDWGAIPRRPIMAMLTAEEVGPDSKMCVADFRDTHALYHTPSRKFVGLSADGQMRLGAGAEMVNGVWYIVEDEDAQRKHRNIPAVSLVLMRIQ